MKNKVLLKRIFHRERWRIAIYFDFDVNLKSKVKSIPGATYSATHRCYYVDDSEENLKLVMKTIRDIAEIDISALTRKEGESVAVVVQPKNEGRENSPPELQSSPESADRRMYGPVEFRISEKEGLLVIKFLGFFDHEWIREMRSYGNLEFDKKRKEWLLPWSKMTVTHLPIILRVKE